MADGILTGHAIKVRGAQADHTYVTSSLGHVWSCFGRSAGGRAICAGSGNALKADCLAQPNSKAGIRYGISGVCHQAANRILYPACTPTNTITVARARGSLGSIFAWGVYGRDPSNMKVYSPPTFSWPELAICNSGHNHQ